MKQTNKAHKIFSVAGGHRVRLGLISACVLLLSSAALSFVLFVPFAPQGARATFPVFESTDFVREKGKPRALKNSFSVRTLNTEYVLRIVNGGQNNQYRTTSKAAVWLNGVRVVRSKDFNRNNNDDSDSERDDDDDECDSSQNTRVIEKRVTLAASNTLVVKLRGAPGSGITLEIYGIDRGLPSITASAASVPNAAAWNQTDVTVSFACADSISGIAMCPSPVTVAAEGANQVVTGKATDRAGNSASASLTLNIDKTPPSVTASTASPANANAWHNADVTVRFDATDNLAGVSSVTPPVTVTAEGANQVVTGTATDRAGNSASASATLNIDKSPPTASAVLEPPPNASGWHNTDVTVRFEATDSLSGIGSLTAPIAVTAEGRNQEVRGTAIDRAGNTTATSAHVSLDKTPPAVGLISPSGGARLNATGIVVTGTISDLQSGVSSVTCNGVAANVSGSTFSCDRQLSEGSNSITVHAVDLAGNEGSASINVIRDTIPPLVHITSPINLSVLDSSSITVSGTVDDETAAVQVKGVAALTNGGSFTATNVPLQEGSNALTATATDGAGNTGTASVTVTRQIISAGLFVTSISPQGASLGDLVTITGSGFGTNRHAVRVRFSFSSGTENLVIEQPAFSVANSSLVVAIPLAVPERTNRVEVLVVGEATPPVSYHVGPLPWDPTPADAGNETVEFISEMDELMRRADSKLDAWYLETDTLPQAEVEQIHQTMQEFRSAFYDLRYHIESQDIQTRHALDMMLSTEFMNLGRVKLRAAIAALDGSPLGSIMCEGNAVSDVLADILEVLDVIDTVIDTIVTSVRVACGISTVATILTAGATAPLATIVCGPVMSIVVQILDRLEDILTASSAIIASVARAAPIEPVPGSYFARVDDDSQLGTPARPGFVYVEGTPSRRVNAFSDFHNPQCLPNGCGIVFDGLEISEVLFTVTGFTPIVAPYKRAEDLLLVSNLAFPPGSGGQAGFTQIGEGSEGRSLFTGLDVNGPAWVRGDYTIEISSRCGAQTLGPVPRTFTLVSGPLLQSVEPAAAQLGSTIKLCGQFLPEFPGTGSVANFGDATAQLAYSVGTPNCVQAKVPDTLGQSGVRLDVDGRQSAAALPFNVLPPMLSSASPDPAFPGERVELRGTGFATDLANNVLTINGVPVTLIGRTNTGLIFDVGGATTDGQLQLTAVGIHTSNGIPFGVARWMNPAARLSHADRDADKPVVAALSDGTVGVAWMDRHRAGGKVRLLFSSAAPGDAQFRSPTSITEDLAGFHSAPQRPTLAGGPDGRFHLIWVNTLGEIRMASLPAGEMPAGDRLVAAPSSGYTFRDPVIAVTASGIINISTVQIPLNGDFNYTLEQSISSDGGATFGPVTPFEGPAPHLGDIDLEYSNGRMWRAFTKSMPRETFTQSSTDGVAWSQAVSAQDSTSCCSEGGDLARAPSVSGDTNGAVVAWDTPTGSLTRAVVGKAEPYSANNFFVFAGRFVGNGGRPSLVMDSTGVVSVAWIERVDGQSPDGVSGVPRLHFNRSFNRLASLSFVPDSTPGAPATDTTTIDSRPSLAVDANRRLHLVWLEGPAGNRVVRYTTTANVSYNDSVADDPPKVEAPPRSLIAVSTENESHQFNGTLLIDPERPMEVRWLAGTYPSRVSVGQSQWGPSFTSGAASLLYEGADHLAALPSLSDLGDETTPFVSIASNYRPPPGNATGGIINAGWTPNGRVVALRYYLFFKSNGAVDKILPKIFISSPTDTRFLSSAPIPGLSQRSEDNPVVSLDGKYLAYEREEKPTPSSAVEHSLRVIRLDPVSEVANLAGGYHPSWSPVENKIAFVQSQTLMEYIIGAGNPVARLNLGGEIQWPLYSPNGQDIVFQFRQGGNWMVRFASGSVVPSEAGKDDTRPVWSPDGQAIIFIRTDPLTRSSELMRWDLGASSAQALTDLPDFVILGGAQTTCRNNFYDDGEPDNVCFPGRAAWAQVPQ